MLARIYVELALQEMERFFTASHMFRGLYGPLKIESFSTAKLEPPEIKPIFTGPLGLPNIKEFSAVFSP
jgi:hypothetical protein